MTAKKRIPGFADVEEERAFWDTVDIADLADGELTPVVSTWQRRRR
jgi:hypothetical protein